MSKKSNVNQHRLKIYIPQWKLDYWESYLEKYDPYSQFFFNFSRWVRQSIITIPESNLIIHRSRDIDISDIKEKPTRIEKTIWVSSYIFDALSKNKGILSLNQYIIYILDYNVFGGSKQNDLLLKLVTLENRVVQLERQIDSLFEQKYLLLGKSK
jgi:hypothetical protein